MSLYILDLIGVFAFAIYGSYKAFDKQFDLFGVFVSAALTALGGGAIREMLLHSYPVFLLDPVYAAVVGAGVVVALFLYRYVRAGNAYLLLIDAIGLTTFAFIGAQRADQAGFGLGVMVFFAVLTAAGGGILSDLVTGRVPQVFRHDFYATPAMVLAIGYFFMRPHLGNLAVTCGLLTATIMLRMVAVHRGVSLWRPYASRSSWAGWIRRVQVWLKRAKAAFNREVGLAD